MTPSEAVLRRTQSLAALVKHLSTPEAARWLAKLDELTYMSGRAEMGLLSQGELFTWRADLLQAARMAAESMPSQVTYSPDLPPTPHGIFVFDDPIDFENVKYSTIGVGWVTFGEFVQFYYYQRDPNCFGAMKAFAAIIVKSGIDFSSQPVENRNIYSRPFAEGCDKTASDGLVRFVIASWLWLKQRVMVYQQERANSSAAKQAARLQVPATVNVVVLRRSQSSGLDDESSSSSREWSCQWLVRGHWRQQYYSKTAQHRPIWIEPYVKGPDDQPFKAPSDTVFAVTR